MPDDGNATLSREGATLGRFKFVPYSFPVRSRFVPSFPIRSLFVPGSFLGLSKEPVLSLPKGLP